MPAFNKPDESDEKRDPLYDYLQRTSQKGKRLERLDALLRQLNLQTASALQSIERPPKNDSKN